MPPDDIAHGDLPDAVLERRRAQDHHGRVAARVVGAQPIERDRRARPRELAGRAVWQRDGSSPALRRRRVAPDGLGNAQRLALLNGEGALSVLLHDHLHGRPQRLRGVEVAQQPLLGPTARVVHALAVDGHHVARGNVITACVVRKIDLDELHTSAFLTSAAPAGC